jgi:Tfp pilus assembly protein PilE
MSDMPTQIRLTQQRGTTLINMAVAALIVAALYAAVKSSYRLRFRFS